MIAVLASIPAISPYSLYAAFSPFIFVLSISVIREGVEDFQRFKSDKETNAQQVRVLRDGHWI